MKRSRAVPLILLGTLSLLTACSSGDKSEEMELQQQTYASREDCLNDWGNDERNCTPAQQTAHAAGNTGTRGLYVGPRFFWYHSGGYPIAVDRDGSTRPLPSSYLDRPGTAPRSIGVTTTTAHVTGRYVGGGRQTGTSGGTHGGAGHVSRGGFGGIARGFSGGG